MNKEQEIMRNTLKEINNLENNNQKQFSEMNTIEFLEDVMNFALTKEQKLLLTMFEELKSKKKENNINFYPSDSDGNTYLHKDGMKNNIYKTITVKSPTITYGSEEDTLEGQLKKKYDILRNKANLL
jgi:hypothetical protein